MFEVSIEGSFITTTPQGNYTRPEILVIKNRKEASLEFGSMVIAEIINEIKKENDKVNTYVIRIADTSRD